MTASPRLALLACLATLGGSGCGLQPASDCGGRPCVDAGRGGGAGSSGGGAASGGGIGAGGGSASGGGGAACSPGCSIGRACCGGACVNTANDPFNCGGCGVKCSGATPYCAGSCQPAPCDRGGSACAGGALCCGTQCCAAGDLCCESSGPVSGAPSCFTPTAQQQTCLPGCSPQCVSDRNAKRDVVPVDERAVLEGVAGLPFSTWRYRSEPAEVRHLGPMAQDFHQAFGLGTTELAYDSIDAHGVSMAAIKGLYLELRDQKRRLDALEAENRALRRALEAPVCGP